MSNNAGDRTLPSRQCLACHRNRFAGTLPYNWRPPGKRVHGLLPGRRRTRRRRANQRPQDELPV